MKIALTFKEKICCSDVEPLRIKLIWWNILLLLLRGTKNYQNMWFGSSMIYIYIYFEVLPYWSMVLNPRNTCKIIRCLYDKLEALGDYVYCQSFITLENLKVGPANTMKINDVTLQMYIKRMCQCVCQCLLNCLV